MSERYCDRHGVLGNEFVDAEHEVVVGNRRWKLCDDCKKSLYNWFGNFPNAHDHVGQHEDTHGAGIEERLKEIS